MTDIEILESLKSYTSKPEVIDRAIVALRQEPICETLTSGYVQEIKAECEDAISRTELVRKLNAWDHNINAIPNYVWKVIRELPSVTPAEKQEPKYCDRNICMANEYNGIGCAECEVTKSQETKMGHWIDTGSGQECSECGEIQYGYDNFRHFCANCGSRMEVCDATDN